MESKDVNKYNSVIEMVKYTVNIWMEIGGILKLTTVISMDTAK